MTPTDTQRHMAAQAALYALHPRARLIHLRASGRLILATLAMPDGTLRMVRAATADQPEFDSLPERERSRIRSAFLALQSQHGGENAAA
jgi:hypothetical protein